jgi:hypothetical protein
MSRLSRVVAEIHRKREQEERLKSDNVFGRLFPDFRTPEEHAASFSGFRDPHDTFDDDDDVDESPVQARPRRRSRNSAFESRDASFSQAVDLQIIRWNLPDNPLFLP